MSLRRSPPTSRSSPMSKESDSKASESASGCSAPSKYTENVTVRRRVDNSPSITESLNKLRSMLAASIKESSGKLTTLESAMKEILSQYNGIKESIDFMSAQYDYIKQKMDTMEKEKTNEKEYIYKLEQKIENLERTFLATKLDMRNVPKKKGESKSDLCDIVVKTASVLQVPITNNEIKDVYRLNNKSGGNTTVVVDLISAVTKDKLTKSARKFNSKTKLNTSHLSLEGPTIPIYISETLSTKSRRLFYLARTFAKNRKFKYCWTSYGKVYLRQDDDSKHIRINSETDIEKLNHSPNPME